MTPKQFEDKLLAKIAKLKKADLIYPVATKIHADMTERIFTKGVDGANTEIGQYDTTPAYFTKKQFKKQGAFKAQGKNAKARTRRKLVKETKRGFDIKKVYTGKIEYKSVTSLAAGSGKFKNGKPRKSMYIQQGYKGLRAAQGYETKHVNLNYTADLRNDFASKLKVEGGLVVAVVSRDINSKKIDWLSAKYGKSIFTHTEKEREFFKTEVTKKLINYLAP